MQLPVYRDVSIEVLQILTFVKLNKDITILLLRHILSGISVPFADSPSVLGLFRHWSLSEIAQFLDFLLRESYVRKEAAIVEDVPTHTLRITDLGEHLLSRPSNVLFPVYEESTLSVFCSSSIIRHRHHAAKKRRFYPKL